MIKLIAAVASGGVIGRGGDIPWDLPEDRRIFKELTMGCVLIMGRVTYESIGRPLPGREIIVVSSSGLSGVTMHGNEITPVTLSDVSGRLSRGYLSSVDQVQDQVTTGVRTAGSIEEAIHMAGDRDIFICGGERIYAEGLALADMLYITRVELVVEGDRYFPQDFEKDFLLTYRERLSANCTLMISHRKSSKSLPV